MTQEELRLEIFKTLFPIYKDVASFRRVSNEIYNWVAPNGLKSIEEQRKNITESVSEKKK